MPEFFERKMRALFNRFDADGSGEIEQSEFEAWSDRLISYGNLDSTKAEELRLNIGKAWSKLTVASTSGKVDFDAFLTYTLELLADDTRRASLRAIVPIIFDAINRSKNGSVTKEEFSNYFKSINVTDEAVAHEVFNAMDKDGSGELSKEEFAAFGTEFFAGTDESSPARLFFGPLP